MQKVFQECATLDRRCYEEYGLNEDILMEHAATGIENYIRSKFPPNSSILIVTGSGNNGADGITIARLLYGDYDVRLYLHSEPVSEMAIKQYKRAKALGIVTVSDIEEADVVLDAIFGSGQNRELDRKTADLINKLNSLRGKKIACDISTGIDENGNIKNTAFKADITFAMGALKRSYFLDDVKDFVGEIIVVSLGISQKLYENETKMFALEESDLVLPSRKLKTTHKGTFGHVAILCGEKEGAAILAGMAALKFGAGLVTLVNQEKILTPPYLMHSNSIPQKTTAMAIGMGLGAIFEEDFLDHYVVKSNTPIVLDADAMYSRLLLSILEQNKRKVVITPHPKEFVSLLKILFNQDITLDELQEKRFEYVSIFSKKFPTVVLLLKGANTIISYNKEIYINPIGCSRLSKGGSGDVLSGLIVSLLAQGYDALHSALQGSLALTLAAKSYNGSSYALMADELIDEIGKLEKLNKSC